MSSEESDSQSQSKNKTPPVQNNFYTFGEAIKASVDTIMCNNPKKKIHEFPFPQCKKEHMEFTMCLKEDPDMCSNFYHKLCECMHYKTDLNMTQ